MVWKVQETIKQMTPLKVPSPDGMPFLFYQTYLNFVGDDVSQSILNFHNSVTLPAHLNHTFIILIPRVKSLEFASEFKPINLYNVLTKSF